MLELSVLRQRGARELVACLEEEARAEERRRVELVLAGANADAKRWVAKRQQQDREASKARIERLRHANEMALVGKLVEYGFMR